MMRGGGGCCGFGMKIRGDMGIADFMGRMGVEVWGNWCKRFISFVRCIKIRVS
jgi:hypothetical protein